MRRGFTLAELLVTLAVMGVLVLFALRALMASASLERGQRPLLALSEEASLLASVLSRELFVAGYGLTSGTALSLTSGGSSEDTLSFRYACESGMEGLCFSQGVNRVKGVTYRVNSGVLQGGFCLDPDPQGFPACNNGLPTNLGQALEARLEAFRVAYRSGGNWTRGNLTVSMGASGASPKVEALAIYFRFRGEGRGPASFTPGGSVAWRDGLSLSTFGLGDAPLTDGAPRAERLVVVLTPNLNR
ncbi:MAG: prepilin-type N-terminal cleavage/methylation domain-containing protein [Thermus sp.]|uniref:prepilin-type N-terminal cleavage/methylation domain-containing protein n=1 Tax=Thermus sp. TaxID=275 RepID=UPI00298F2492|nr:prepilin-type N-terminal cleavage/methylation domain-containing protein [Thermus sp.]MDW8018264.1 prepilin-type N-terminal cleavage/methylation domain-containing protein [Thermus sp.]